MCDRRLLAKGWINWVINLKELVHKLFIKVAVMKTNYKNERKIATFEQQVSGRNALNNINKVLINR